MLGRSLETVTLRMHAAARSAEAVAAFLADHPAVTAVHFLGRDAPDPTARRIYETQCSGPGSTFSIEIRGGQSEAFNVLNQTNYAYPQSNASSSTFGVVTAATTFPARILQVALKLKF